MVARPSANAPGFAFRSGRLCLDFAATLMFRGTDEPTELLVDGTALARWALESGAVSRLRRGPVDPADAIELREAVYRAATGRLAGFSPTAADRRTLNHFAGAARVAPSLTEDGTLARVGTLTEVIATIACDTVELLGGEEAERLRQCGREGCTRLFVDRSRGANRTWCGMRECGNRVNAAAYRRRRRRQPGR
jgi:predicted RNA-binding Zn ribbon-like protein